MNAGMAAHLPKNRANTTVCRRRSIARNLAIARRPRSGPEIAFDAVLRWCGPVMIVSYCRSGLTPCGKLRARPASAQQSCDNASMHYTAAQPARQLHLLVMPMQKENASRADEAYNGDELNLPRSYCRRPRRSPHHAPTNVTARATKPDAIQRARPREATKPTTTCTMNRNCHERAVKHRRI